MARRKLFISWINLHGLSVLHRLGAMFQGKLEYKVIVTGRDENGRFEYNSDRRWVQIKRKFT